MMHSFRQRLIIIFSVLFLFICIVHSSEVKAEEQHANEQDHGHDVVSARLEALKSILSRRSLYDPAFGDSWSNYFEKRNLFDPAYTDWANTFKRSDKQAKN